MEYPCQFIQCLKSSITVSVSCNNTLYVTANKIIVDDMIMSIFFFIIVHLLHNVLIALPQPAHKEDRYSKLLYMPL